MNDLEIACFSVCLFVYLSPSFLSPVHHQAGVDAET
jgi:hypothetical protein